MTLSGHPKKALSEKQIENQILSFLKFNNILAFKIKSTGTYDEKIGRFRTPSPWYRKGVADILGIYKGKPLALEVKSRKGNLSIHQKLFLQDFKNHGGIIGVVRSVEDVEQVLGIHHAGL